jgi:uncharacterized protein (DUF2267 family)
MDERTTTSPPRSLDDATQAARLYAELAEAGLPPGVSAKEALLSVVCVLERRLGPEAEHLLATLPEPVRPLAETCPRHRRDPAEVFDRDGFLARVAAHLDGVNGAPEEAAELTTDTVFKVLHRWLPANEVDEVTNLLPVELRELWLHSAPHGLAVEQSPVVADILQRLRVAAPLPPGKNEREVFVGVLCPLALCLGGDGTRGFASALPAGLAPAVVPCALHAGDALAGFELEEFLRRVATHLGTSPLGATSTSLAVFGAIKRVMSNEADRAAGRQLPQPLRAMWEAAPALAV